MADISGLRAVAGVTPKIYARLKPWLCVLPVAEPVRLNVNTLAPAQAPLLAMLLPGELGLADARAVLAARPAGGYGSSVRFWAAGPLARLHPRDDVAAPAGMTSRWLGRRTRAPLGARSEEPRVGKVCVGTCRTAWSRGHEKKQRSI